MSCHIDAVVRLAMQQQSLTKILRPIADLQQKLTFQAVWKVLKGKFTPKLFFDICFDIGLTSRK